MLVIDKQTDRAQSRNLWKALKTLNRSQGVLSLGMGWMPLRKRSRRGRCECESDPGREDLSESWVALA